MCLFSEKLSMKDGILFIMATTVLYMIEVEYFFFIALNAYALTFALAIAAIGTYYVTNRGYFIRCGGKVIQSRSLISLILYSLLNTVYLPMTIPLYAIIYRKFKRDNENCPARED